MIHITVKCECGQEVQFLEQDFDRVMNTLRFAGYVFVDGEEPNRNKVIRAMCPVCGQREARGY